MVNFASTRIYGAYCGNVLEYVGSTAQEKFRRHYEHKSDSKNPKRCRLWHKHVLATGGFGKRTFKILETFPCGSRREQNIREQHWIDTLSPKYNEVSAHGTVTNAEYCRRWYQKNRAYAIRYTTKSRAIKNAQRKCMVQLKERICRI